MTRTTNAFGGLAFAVLAMFALWTSTLAMPPASAVQAAGQVAAGGRALA